MRKRIVATVSALALLFTFASVVDAATWYPPGSNCSVYIISYGNINYQPNGAGEMRFCWKVDRGIRLSLITDNIDSNCMGFLGIDSGNWASCISSIGRTSGFPTWARLCAYTTSSPSNHYYEYNPNTLPIPNLGNVGYNDAFNYYLYIDNRTEACYSI